MSSHLILVEKFAVNPGAVAEFSEVVGRVCEAVAAEDPEAVGFAFHMSEDETTAVCIKIHPTVEAFMRHGQVMQRHVPSLFKVAQLLRVEIHGPCPPPLLDAIREATKELGEVEVVNYGRTAGFVR